MTTSPTFSIVMPAYRTARYIGDAIGSVLAQSRADWELIVIDDASPDDAVAKVEPFLTDPRIRLERLARNSGLSAARNAGARLATGEFVTMLDSDDLLDPRYLQHVADEFGRRSTLALVGFENMRFIDRDGHPCQVPTATLAEPPPPEDHELMLMHLLRGPYAYHGATFRRRIYHEVGGFDESCPSFEDIEMWARLAASGQHISILRDQLYIYRITDDSITRGAGRAREVEQRRLDAINSIGARYATSRRQRRAVVRHGRPSRCLIAALDTRSRLERRDWAGARRAALSAAYNGPSLRTFAVLATTALPAPLISRISAWRHGKRTGSL